jgi:hypothetical protein
VSRRWYRYAGKVVFFGWDPAEQGFYLNTVDLCLECHGSGEIADTEEVCRACGGEGIQLNRINPSTRRGGLSIEALADEFARQALPCPEAIRADLEADRLANAATLLHEYDPDALGR